MADKRKYDSTVARIAGNVAGHMIDRILVVHLQGDQRGFTAESVDHIAIASVSIARAIVARVERTEPKAE